ncbi:MAG: hypothetical protein ABSH31_03055, partial [Bryobacteraceae bacterium]
MIDRRSALKIGATTLAAALVRGSALGKSPSRSGYERAVFDERFDACRVFGAQFARSGVPASAIRGDVAELWYEDLRAALSKRRAPIAGLTNRPALFCLEELARDVGMRVILRVDHTLEPDVRHVVAQLRRFGTLEPRDASAQKRTGP